MNESFVTVCGNVTDVPEVKHGKDTGHPFTVFRLAQNTSRREPDGALVDTGVSFYDVIAFGALGANVADSVGMGNPVVVHGRLRVREWSSGEKKGIEVQIEAHSIGPNLTFGTTQFTKRRKAARQGHDRIALEVQGRPVSVDGNGEVFEEPTVPGGDLGVNDQEEQSGAVDDSQGSRLAS